MAKNMQNIPSMLIVQSRRKEIEDSKKEYARVRSAQETLENKPDDPDANGQVGRYLCFIQRDWTSGLPRLAKGTDAPLRLLAEQDLANPGDTTAMVKLGDGWWDLALKQPAGTKAPIQDHALERYKRAWQKTAGEVRDRLRVRFLTAQMLKHPGNKPGKPAPIGVPQAG